MGLDVLLVARPGTTQRTTVYAVDLVLEGNRLLVDTWAPRASFAGPAPPANTETAAAPAAAAREGAGSSTRAGC